ncbi:MULTISPECIES: FtsQ-type POTRA domain-containing protein [unclassified Pseudodesulfovibrio]|uniref:cell division protein FtsQ/DivIB n=1 Tax=unclassified Pseudodesulfovibrio TaxID=2661612 RepID=UPI000FEBDD80|nr:MULTISPECIES: FtsQ-type POTRA domain-containing protein [unclassified Pseudodesulfovibrio]MCJ2164905.1 FtsQ-type POTRA domain-containing protein [Pseudodesulfovibrio sp. S3-i]RWU03732.1 peptide ABC transporter permease [Pseudodesulfovibrio sp. S3]
MSTLTMGKQSRLNLGGKRTARGNSHKRKAPARTLQSRSVSVGKLVNVGQFFMRLVMTMLVLSLISVLGVGLLFGYRYITTHPYFELKEINVTGTDRLTNGDILNCADVALGLNCLSMNVGEVENRLSANPWIESVIVRREIPDRLHIDVKEKVPAFWIRQGDGLYFADAHGKVIAPMHPGEMASLPVLSVAESLDDGPEVLNGILRKMADHQTPFTQAQTAWIKLTSAHELEIYLDSHAGGQGLTVKLSMDRWEVQLERLKVVWRDLLRRNEFKDAAIIAASGDKIWIQKRPAPAKS